MTLPARQLLGALLPLLGVRPRRLPEALALGRIMSVGGLWFM